eukprot:1141820-Pelagomonas_calceolata.AAC.5
MCKSLLASPILQMFVLKKPLWGPQHPGSKYLACVADSCAGEQPKRLSDWGEDEGCVSTLEPPSRAAAATLQTLVQLRACALTQVHMLRAGVCVCVCVFAHARKQVTPPALTALNITCSTFLQQPPSQTAAVCVCKT